MQLINLPDKKNSSGPEIKLLLEDKDEPTEIPLSFIFTVCLHQEYEQMETYHQGANRTLLFLDPGSGSERKNILV